MSSGEPQQMSVRSPKMGRLMLVLMLAAVYFLWRVDRGAAVRHEDYWYFGLLFLFGSWLLMFGVSAVWTAWFPAPVRPVMSTQTASTPIRCIVEGLMYMGLGAYLFTWFWRYDASIVGHVVDGLSVTFLMLLGVIRCVMARSVNVPS